MTVFAVILDTLSEFATILAFLAVTGVATWLFLEKTSVGRRFMDMTPWMGWNEEETEDEYTNFVIHPSNYIKVPSR